MSNPNSREPWRHTSVIAPVANGSIAGLGRRGYLLAIDAVAGLLSEA
ncbi:MAG: type II 3-dehydroquinate dehydratase [Actinomycetota bacterium]